MKFYQPLDKNVVGKTLGACNQITAIHIPIGITVYISLDEILDVKRDYILSDILELKQNEKFAKAKELFLHTLGSSLENLILDIVTVGTDGIYIKNTKKQELSLDSDVGSSLTLSLQKQFNDGFTTPIPPNSFYTLDTNKINSIQFTIDQPISVEINNNGVLFPLGIGTFEYFTKNIISMKFYNQGNANESRVTAFTDGILAQNQAYADNGYFVDDYVN